MHSDIATLQKKSRQRIGFSLEIETFLAGITGMHSIRRQRIGFSLEIETEKQRDIKGKAGRSPEDWLLA